MVVADSVRRVLLSTATAEPHSGGGGAQQPQSGPVKREFLFSSLLYFLFICGGGGEQKQSGGGGVLCVRDTCITCNVRSIIMVRQAYLMSHSVESAVVATMRVS